MVPRRASHRHEAWGLRVRDGTPQRAKVPAARGAGLMTMGRVSSYGGCLARYRGVTREPAGLTNEPVMSRAVSSYVSAIAASPSDPTVLLAGRGAPQRGRGATWSEHRRRADRDCHRALRRAVPRRDLPLGSWRRAGAPGGWPTATPCVHGVRPGAPSRTPLATSWPVWRTAQSGAAPTGARPGSAWRST